MSSDILRKGLDLAKEATEEDNKKNYDAALRLYEQAIQYLITGIKYEKNKRTQELIEAKCKEYLARAEKLKESLAAPAPKPVASGAGKGETDDDDAEKDL